MPELTKEQERIEGQAATQLKNDPGFARAVDLARSKILGEWIAAKTVEQREQLHADYHSVTRVLDQLDVVEGRGHLAQAALKQHAKTA